MKRTLSSRINKGLKMPRVCYKEKELTASDTFEAGETYEGCVSGNPDSEYDFADSSTVTFNGYPDCKCDSCRVRRSMETGLQMQKQRETTSVPAAKGKGITDEQGRSSLCRVGEQSVKRSTRLNRPEKCRKETRRICMKKGLGFLLAAALMLTASFSVAAEEDVTGEWYANLYGMPVTLTLDESGEYTMQMEGFEEEEEEEPQTGTWELDGEAVIMDKGGEDEMSFAYDGETLYADMDGMEMLFSRDPEAAAGFVPAEIRTDASIEEFAGKWTGTQMSAFGMIVPLEMMEMEKVELDIKDNKVSFTMAGGDMFGEWELPDLEAELKDGVLTFTVLAEDEYSEDTEWSVRLHEDGMLSLAVNMMDEEMVIYMEPAEEETEETEE
ncbi:MAG: hypothetical protein Q4B72_11565 [Lachnospiraceae bacterium]|nr:hypothetical protein [Lachnospiraceae bacterium]